MHEYRLHVSVAGLAFPDESGWEPFIEFLERRYAEMGPVISWDEATLAIVTVAVDSDSEAHATEAGVSAVSDALHSSGLGSLYPKSVEVEPTGEYAPA